jgi:hypothetical protein
MQPCHRFAALSVRFDDPNLVSCAGLVPAVELARRSGLVDLVEQRSTVPAANRSAKVAALVAGMLAGADSIEDMDLLRHGGMGRLFAGVRAPSTLGTFLRAFTFGHVRHSSTRSPPGCWKVWPGMRRCCRALRRLRSSTSTTRSGAPMGTPSRAPGTATRG